MDAEEVLMATTKKIGKKDLLPKKKKIAKHLENGDTLRKRWRKTMFFQKVDNIPNFEFGYWERTLTNWHKEGLPNEVKDEKSAYEYFGIENWRTAPINNTGLLPAFEYKIISEDAETQTFQDGNGTIAQINKTGDKSIPHYLDFRLKTRKDWEEFREKLIFREDRIPKNWKDLAEAYNERDYPLAVPRGSLVGIVRNWMGFEGIALMVYDDPEFLEEIVETLCILVCESLERILPDVEFDFAAGWEDICFNSGPIVGVDFMKNIVSPRYNRISDLLRKHGCFVSWTDGDGNIMPIVDSFLDGGINCMFPVEVHAGSDPVELRKKYPGILLHGGFCKMKLLQGKNAIREEFERIKPIVREGGFIPGIDHRVQADVKLENYKYYLKLKRDILGAGGKPQYDESRI